MASHRKSCPKRNNETKNLKRGGGGGKFHLPGGIPLDVVVNGGGGGGPMTTATVEGLGKEGEGGSNLDVSTLTMESTRQRYRYKRRLTHRRKDEEEDGENDDDDNTENECDDDDDDDDDDDSDGESDVEDGGGGRGAGGTSSAKGFIYRILECVNAPTTTRQGTCQNRQKKTSAASATASENDDDEEEEEERSTDLDTTAETDTAMTDEDNKDNESWKCRIMRKAAPHASAAVAAVSTSAASSSSLLSSRIGGITRRATSSSSSPSSSSLPSIYDPGGGVSPKQERDRGKKKELKYVQPLAQEQQQQPVAAFPSQRALNPNQDEKSTQQQQLEREQQQKDQPQPWTIHAWRAQRQRWKGIKERASAAAAAAAASTAGLMEKGGLPVSAVVVIVASGDEKENGPNMNPNTTSTSSGGENDQDNHHLVGKAEGGGFEAILDHRRKTDPGLAANGDKTGVKTATSKEEKGGFSSATAAPDVAQVSAAETNSIPATRSDAGSTALFSIPSTNAPMPTIEERWGQKTTIATIPFTAEKSATSSSSSAASPSSRLSSSGKTPGRKSPSHSTSLSSSSPSRTHFQSPQQRWRQYTPQQHQTPPISRTASYGMQSHSSSVGAKSGHSAETSVRNNTSSYYDGGGVGDGTFKSEKRRSPLRPVSEVHVMGSRRSSGYRGAVGSTPFSRGNGQSMRQNRIVVDDESENYEYYDDYENHYQDERHYDEENEGNWDDEECVQSDGNRHPYAYEEDLNDSSGASNSRLPIDDMDPVTTALTNARIAINGGRQLGRTHPHAKCADESLNSGMSSSPSDEMDELIDGKQRQRLRGGPRINSRPPFLKKSVQGGVPPGADYQNRHSGVRSEDVYCGVGSMNEGGDRMKKSVTFSFDENDPPPASPVVDGNDDEREDECNENHCESDGVGSGRVTSNDDEDPRRHPYRHKPRSRRSQQHREEDNVGRVTGADSDAGSRAGMIIRASPGRLRERERRRRLMHWPNRKQSLHRGQYGEEAFSAGRHYEPPHNDLGRQLQRQYAPTPTQNAASTASPSRDSHTSSPHSVGSNSGISRSSTNIVRGIHPPPQRFYENPKYAAYDDDSRVAEEEQDHRISLHVGVMDEFINMM